MNRRPTLQARAILSPNFLPKDCYKLKLDLQKTIHSYNLNTLQQIPTENTAYYLEIGRRLLHKRYKTFLPRFQHEELNKLKFGDVRNLVGTVVGTRTSAMKFD